MDRRNFIGTALSLTALPAFASVNTPASVGGRTRWNVIGSEGYDAIAFLGPLSGQELYRRFYAEAADSFSQRLPQAITDDVPRLAEEAGNSSFGLLWPVLANMLSGAGVTSLASVIRALSDVDAPTTPSFLLDRGHDEEKIVWLRQNAARLIAVFEAMREADFASFRLEQLGHDFETRRTDVGRQLSGHDVIAWHEKLTGRRFDPLINVVLLAFSKPHGAKMQGQTFLQAADYDVATTVRIAAHEMLHPPIPMDGPVATATLATLRRDPLIMRIVREHDPRWGYTTLEGLLNEDICQALDQIISEELGVARDPAQRWHKSDDGMHVLAAGLYGLLKRDGWNRTGGNFELWLGQVVETGRLAPAAFHPVAADVLGRPKEQLWPLAEQVQTARPVVARSLQKG